MGETISAPSSPAVAPVPKYRLHWHVFLTHFPLSFFGVAFGFQLLHLFAYPSCFEMATNITLIAGTVMTVPTSLTGWWTWKTRFRKGRGLIFRRKIAISYYLLAVSIPLTVWRMAFLEAFEEAPYSFSHWIYFAGNALLILGAVAEGFYGSRLNHR
jgi:uncharacterized membrane protein